MTGSKPYTILFKRYWQELLYYCNKKMEGDEETALDMSEFAFVKLWENFITIKSDEHAKAYLYVVARNACLSELARIKRQGAISIESVPTLENFLFEEPLWDYDMMNADIIHFVSQQIEKLPWSCKTTIKLFIEGYSSDEIAIKMQCTRKTALNQKLMGISKIKESLKLRYG